MYVLGVFFGTELVVWLAGPIDEEEISPSVHPIGLYNPQALTGCQSLTGLDVGDSQQSHSNEQGDRVKLRWISNCRKKQANGAEKLCVKKFKSQEARAARCAKFTNLL